MRSSYFHCNTLNFYDVTRDPKEDMGREDVTGKAITRKVMDKLEKTILKMKVGKHNGLIQF